LRRLQPRNAPKAFAGPLDAPPDLLTGFKSGGRDKGRMKGEKTGGGRQLREWDTGRREGAGGEKGRKSWRRMEAEISQGRPYKGILPATQNASQKS